MFRDFTALVGQLRRRAPLIMMVSTATKYSPGLGSREVPVSRIVLQGEIVIEYPVREVVFTHQRQRQRSTSAIENGCNVRVAIKTAAHFGNVIGDDHVKIFAAELFRSVGDEIVGFGGKADQHLAIFVLSKLAQNIRIGFQSQVDG